MNLDNKLKKLGIEPEPCSRSLEEDGSTSYSKCHRGYTTDQLIEEIKKDKRVKRIEFLLEKNGVGVWGYYGVKLFEKDRREDYPDRVLDYSVSKNSFKSALAKALIWLLEEK